MKRQAAKKKQKAVIRLCNRCNAVKASNAWCQVCGCPEFRIDAGAQWHVSTAKSRLKK